MINDLIPWDHELTSGVTVRGFYTNPTGKPVLHFVHGNGFCGLTYEVLLSKLQGHVDLFISDAQGHGDSDEGDGFRGWNETARDIAEVWDEYQHLYEGVPKIASGHSFGAVMSTLIMADNPRAFDAALLLDPTYAPPAMASAISVLGSVGLMKHFPLAKQAQIRSVKWSNENALWEYFHQRGVFKEWRDECLSSYLDHAMTKESDGSYHLKCPPEIEAAIFASYANGLWPAIKSVSRPVTMFYGKKTYSFILNSRRKLHEMNLNFDFCEMAGGHCFMHEDPDKTAHEMLKKLKLLGLLC